MEISIRFLNPLRVETCSPEALAKIQHQLTTVMAQLTELTEQVKRNTDVEKSAVTLLQGLKAQLDAAGTDPVALKALSDQLGSNTDDLAAAVVANTPAA